MCIPHPIFAVMLTLAALGVATAPAAAQNPQIREGFWGGFGLGWGSMGLHCDGCDGLDRTGSYTGYGKLGGTLRPNLLLGAETNGWSKSEEGGTVALANVSAAVYWYPAVHAGLFLKGGLGYSELSADEGNGRSSEGGWGVLLGLGYDMRVGRMTSITPVLNYFRGSFDGGSADVLQVGVGVTFH